MARASLWQQVKVLFWKNVLLKRRNLKHTLQELLMPVFYIASLALIKGLIKPETKPAIHQFQTVSIHRAEFLHSSRTTLLVVPDSPYTQSVIYNAIDILEDSFKNVTFNALFYDNETEAVASYKNNSSHILAGIIFQTNSPLTLHSLSYSLRTSFSSIASSSKENLFTDQSQCRQGDGLDSSSCDANSYLYTGFAALQVAMDTALMRVKLNKMDISPPNVSVELMPKPVFTPNVNYILVMGALFFVLAYSPFINYLTVNLVAEKEKKIKEGMKMMGMGDLAFWLSWTLIYLLMITIVTAVILAIAVLSDLFTRSNMLLFFFILLLYGISIIGISFMATPFFDKAQVAGGVASMAALMISLLYLIVSLSRTFTASGIEYSIPVWCRWMLCLISPVAIALATDQMIYLDITHPDGLSFTTMMEGEFPVLVPTMFLMLDATLYFLFAIYLDHVVPGEYGPRYSPWFIVSPSFWSGREKEEEPQMYSSYESVPNPCYADPPGSDISEVENIKRENIGKLAVKLERLSKVFDSGDQKITAVNELTVNFYEDQITALLGHNGAGKTTTMNILTGLTRPTHGRATVMGLDVSKPSDIAELRTRTGVCPQHNILFDELTCYEHLMLFAGIKGVAAFQVETEIEEALKSVQLDDQRDVRSSALSGGQKRKLSVAIAIIGDPRIIFLDEPTAGMDPNSRRHLWSVLKEKKKGRVILLTTHFMDEADILADRKCIINHGSLRCCGSSLFLKNRFGIGYHLNMVVGRNCNIAGVEDLVKQHVKGAEVNRVHAQELDITLPLNQVSHFSALFGELENLVQDHEEDGGSEIISYGVSMTTLEEVFLELEKETGTQEANDATQNSKQEGASATADQLTEQHPESNELKEQNVCFDKEQQLHLMSVDNLAACKLNTGWSLSFQQLRSLIKIRVFMALRMKQLFLLQFLLPVLLLLAGLVVSKTSQPEIQGAAPKSLEIGAYYYSRMNNHPGMAGPYGPIPPLLVHDDVGSAESWQVLGEISRFYHTDYYNNQSYLLSVSPHYLGINLTHFAVAAQDVHISYTSFYNDSAVHAIPALINLMSNVILKTEELILGKVDNSSVIKVSSHPWPADYEKIEYTNAAFSSVILLAMAYVLIPASLGIEVVKNRQVRSQLRISGVPFAVYWLSFFLLDAIKFTIPASLMLVITYFLKIPSLEQPGAIASLIMLCMTYIPAGILFSYFTSFAFKKEESAQAVQPILITMVGFIPYIAVVLYDTKSSQAVASLLHVMSCFSAPPYTLFGGIYYITKVYTEAEMNLATDQLTWRSYLTTEIIVSILIPISHTLTSLIFLRILDIRDMGGSWREVFGCHDNTGEGHNEEVEEDEDEDVGAERRKVKVIENQGHDQTHNQVAYVSGLHKGYTSQGEKSMCSKGAEMVKIAVHNSSFVIEPGEVFGLLGPNGAGKSTTLAMMTADTAPTTGKVYIGGQDIRSGSTSQTYKAIGYCPQYDALWDIITLQEHLECYANIKGLPHDHMDTSIKFLKTHLKLEEHQSKYSKKLSGGSKRKLSYCMSMLGGPKIVLLDEPSTGMDPKSKRFLWDTINVGFKGTERGAILTTHYMEEADVLCSRIAIMVNGKLKCLGSSQHLKTKYGSGYHLEVKLKSNEDGSSDLDPCMNKLKQYIWHYFPDAICAEEFSERVEFKIPKSNVTSLAKAFTILEEGKDLTGIEEYNLSQSTLEQIFLDFAKNQLDELENSTIKVPELKQTCSKDYVVHLK